MNLSWIDEMTRGCETAKALSDAAEAGKRELIRRIGSKLPAFKAALTRELRGQIDALRSAFPDQWVYHFRYLPQPNGFKLCSESLPARVMDVQWDRTGQFAAVKVSTQPAAPSRPTLTDSQLHVRLTPENEITVVFDRKVYRDAGQLAEALIKTAGVNTVSLYGAVASQGQFASPRLKSRDAL